jgi:hypothetical protein
MTSRSVTLALLLAAPFLVLAPSAARAEDAAPAKTEAPKVVFSGLVDAFYTVNLTQAQDVVNPLRAYDGPTGFNLNWAKLGATMAPEPGGFKIDLGFGPESVFTTNFFVLQAYGSLKAGPGVLDLGQFTTSAGFEVFESNANWLYSRGLIYQYIVPSVHQGLRYTADVGGGLTVQAGLLNGWESPANAVIDRQLSPRKTAHLCLFYAKDALSGALSVYIGKEPGATDNRLLLDGNVGYKVGALETNLSAAYRTEGDTDKRLGVNFSARYTVSDALKLAGRFEYLKDDKGVALTLPGSANAWNVTAALVHPVGANAEVRVEARYDKVSEDYFAKSATSTDVAKNASTASLAMLAWF